MLLDFLPFLVNINIADVNITVHILHEFVFLFLLCAYLCYWRGFYSTSAGYAKQFPKCLHIQAVNPYTLCLLVYLESLYWVTINNMQYGYSSSQVTFGQAGNEVIKFPRCACYTIVAFTLNWQLLNFHLFLTILYNVWILYNVILYNVWINSPNLFSNSFSCYIFMTLLTE